MPSFIFDDPFRRYQKKRTFLKTPLREKLLVMRRKQPTQTYTMVVAPTTTIETDEPNTVMRAVTNLLGLSHANVINVHEAYLHDDKCWWIMDDWTTGHSRGLGGMDEEEIAELIQRFVSAIRYMHEHGVVHGNLSFEDIHFFRCQNMKLDFKIADLGLGRHVCPETYANLQNKRQRYGCPPEAKKGNFSAAGDVWTIGSIAYLLLTGGVRKTSLTERLDCYKEKLQEKSFLSKHSKQFVMSCLQIDPNKRATLNQLLSHEWFRHNTKKNKSPLSDRTDFLKNIVALDKNDQFKRYCFSKIARQLAHDDLLPYRAIFDGMDPTRQGYLSHDTFAQALNGANIDQDVADKLYDYVDVDGDGHVYLNEFLGAALQFNKDIEKEKIREAFYMMDYDGDGVISAGDFSKTMDVPYKTSMVYLKRTIRSFSGDPIVTEGQFIRIMTGKTIFSKLGWETAIKSTTLFSAARNKRPENNNSSSSNMSSWARQPMKAKMKSSVEEKDTPWDDRNIKRWVSTA